MVCIQTTGTRGAATARRRRCLSPLSFSLASSLLPQGQQRKIAELERQLATVVARLEESERTRRAAEVGVGRAGAAGTPCKGGLGAQRPTLPCSSAAQIVPCEHTSMELTII